MPTDRTASRAAGSAQARPLVTAAVLAVTALSTSVGGGLVGAATPAPGPAGGGVQAATPTPASAPAAPAASAEAADVSITLTVRAAELRYEAVPTVTVRFTGSAGQTTRWDVVHDNLPGAPAPGTTYRDAGIQVVITTSAGEPGGSASASPSVEPAATPSPGPAQP
jgi:hypothetical protein